MNLCYISSKTLKVTAIAFNALDLLSETDKYLKIIYFISLFINMIYYAINYHIVWHSILKLIIKILEKLN